MGCWTIYFFHYCLDFVCSFKESRLCVCKWHSTAEFDPNSLTSLPLVTISFWVSTECSGRWRTFRSGKWNSNLHILVWALGTIPLIISQSFLASWSFALNMSQYLLVAKIQGTSMHIFGALFLQRSLPSGTLSCNFQLRKSPRALISDLTTQQDFHALLDTFFPCFIVNNVPSVIKFGIPRLPLFVSRLSGITALCCLLFNVWKQFLYLFCSVLLAVYCWNENPISLTPSWLKAEIFHYHFQMHFCDCCIFYVFDSYVDSLF